MAHRRTRFGLRASVAVVAALVLAATLTQSQPDPAVAADPDSGSVGPAQPSASWQGQSYPVGATVDPAACPAKSADPDDQLCDHYLLDVDVAPRYWNSHQGGAEVRIRWADSVNDFDLYVYDADTGDLVASSASGGTTSETAVIPEASGKYQVRVLPFLVADSGYQGGAEFTSRSGGDDTPPLGGPAEYHGQRFDDDVPCAQAPCLPDREPRNQAISSPFPSLVLKSGPVGRDAAEPTIAVDSKGRAFYAAATFDGPAGLADTRVLRSTDGGATWVDKTPPNDLPFTLDPYVYIEEGVSRLFDIDLYVGDAYLNFSDDGGRTYETNPIAGGGLDNMVQDHQTLFAGPVPRGSPLTTLDPDFPELLYYCYNKVAYAQCTRSLDGGRSFSGAAMTPPYPGVEPMEGGQFCGGLHGHVVTDDAGRVFLPKGHCGRPYISISNDAGTTWSRGRVSDRIDMPDDHASVAADRDGNLFYVWYDSEHRLPWLAVSRNHGRTWQDPIMIAPPGVHEVQFPVIAAGGKGRITVSFPGTTVNDPDDLTRPWDQYVVVSTTALQDRPVFVSNIANPPTDPVHRGDCPGRCGNMLDFLDVIVSPADGHAAWATTVDTCTARKNCKSDPDAIGFDEDSGSDNAAVDMKGIYIRQISGPRLR